jgi:hypothetical protein
LANPGIRLKKQLSALDFSGSTDTIDFGSDSSLDDLQAFSVLTWMKFRSLTTSKTWWVKEGATESASHFIETDAVIAAKIRALIKQSSGNCEMVTDPILEIDRWMFIAFTYDTGRTTRARVYVGYRGIPAYEPTYDFNTSNSGTKNDDSGGNWQVGEPSGSLSFLAPIDGQIAWHSGYNRALGFVEILELQKDPFSLLPGNVVNAHFNNASVVKDITGYNNNGTVTGATLTIGPQLYVPQSYMIVPGGIVSGAPAASTQAAYIAGSATASDSQSAFIAGPSTTSSDSKSAYIIGQDAASDAQDAYIAGRDTATDAQDAYVAGTDTALDAQAAYVVGASIASDTQAAYVTGQDTASDTQAAYVTGQDTASDTQAAYVTGQDAASDAQAAYVTGQDAASDAQAAYMAGGASVASAQAAYIQGDAVTASDTQAAYISGLTYFPFTEDFTGQSDDAEWRRSHWVTDVT